MMQYFLDEQLAFATQIPSNGILTRNSLSCFLRTKKIELYIENYKNICAIQLK
jgi:hypothetical protein